LSFTCGLVGLPNAGKSTIFAALTGADTLIAPYPFSTLEPRRGIVPLPDPNLEALAGTLRPAKVTPATLEIMDIAGLVEGASRGEGLGNQFLSHIRGTDALLHVVRCFSNEEISQPTGELDPAKDAEIVNTELLLADLEVVERRLERTRKTARAEPGAARSELGFLGECREALGRGLPLHRLPCSEEGRRLMKELGLLTVKPVCYVANVDRGDPGSLALARRLEAFADGAPVIAIDGKLERELAELPPEERAGFARELGIDGSALARLAEIGYRLLGLITFYTVVGEELRAWSLPAGATALDAAAKIHTDLARGFVRAEVVTVAEFLASPAWTTLRDRGLLRVEGRDYRVRDGDILTIRFTP
jgi:GTP-binding protein YchF